MSKQNGGRKHKEMTWRKVKNKVKKLKEVGKNAMHLNNEEFIVWERKMLAGKGRG